MMRMVLSGPSKRDDMRYTIAAFWFIALVLSSAAVGPAEACLRQQDSTFVQFIYTSDAHYGESRSSFRGKKEVDARVVNAAMITAMNAVSTSTFPADGGVKGGVVVGPIEYLIQTGDVANRQESGCQSASASWSQFLNDYVSNVTLRNRQNKKTEVLVVPGNHDVSNAIGFHRTLNPATDASAVVGMYNLMLNPTQPVTNSSFNKRQHKVHFTRDVGGIRFMFLHVWPDSAERLWMSKDLSALSSSTPVLLFAHDPPTAPSRHFTNPNAGHAIDSARGFENILEESLKDGYATSAPSLVEQRGLAAFLSSYPNIRAYFHGHLHENRFYTWRGPDSLLALRVFQVDAPLWEGESDAAETRLSFQVVSIDLSAKRMTIRECLWNTAPLDPARRLVWGSDTTVTLE